MKKIGATKTCGFLWTTEEVDEVPCYTNVLLARRCCIKFKWRNGVVATAGFGVCFDVMVPK